MILALYRVFLGSSCQLIWATTAKHLLKKKKIPQTGDLNFSSISWKLQSICLKCIVQAKVLWVHTKNRLWDLSCLCQNLEILQWFLSVNALPGSEWTASWRTGWISSSNSTSSTFLCSKKITNFIEGKRKNLNTSSRLAVFGSLHKIFTPFHEVFWKFTWWTSATHVIINPIWFCLLSNTEHVASLH